MRKVITLTALILIFCPYVMFGQWGTTLPSSPVIVIIKTMYIDDFQYPFTINGIRMYMSDIQLDNPMLYDSLNPNFKELEDRQSKSEITSWSSVILGGVIFAIGSYMMMTSPDVEDNSNLMLGLGLTTAGAVIGVGGFLIGMEMAPQEADFYGFVNQHNKLNPDHPIKVE